MQSVGRRGGCVHRRDLAALLRGVEWAGVAAAWCGWGWVEEKKDKTDAAPHCGAQHRNKAKSAASTRGYPKRGVTAFAAAGNSTKGARAPVWLASPADLLTGVVGVDVDGHAAEGRGNGGKGGPPGRHRGDGGPAEAAHGARNCCPGCHHSSKVVQSTVGSIARLLFLLRG
jgi:hypothetical protein